MALSVWTQPSGSLGTFQEGSHFDLPLPVDTIDGVTYTLISGKLPGGLWLYEHSILGTPYEVARDTNFSFCIRASKNNQISDRTFTLTISGADSPELLTPAGLLDVGPYKQLFVVDNSYVNYQLEAIDADIAAGQTLTFFIVEGELPLGLSLSPDGIIYGIPDSLTTLKLEEGNGTYDHGFYSSGPYDFASPQAQNGYDLLNYDYVGYDYFTIKTPRTLNRFYEFVVAVTDGDSIIIPKRKYQIYVVSSDYFRADSESLISNSDLYTADVSYVQAPVWLTSSNLGTYRANNYITLVLNVFDIKSIYFKLEEINANVEATAYQQSIYHNNINSNIISIINTKTSPEVGQYIKLPGSNIFNQITDVLKITTNQYSLTLASPLDIALSNGTKFFIGTRSEIPPGMSFDGISGDIFGRVPAQSATTKLYTFTVTATRIGDLTSTETSSTSRIFNVNIIGEIESAVIWNTPSNLGYIDAGYDSLLYINATSLVTATISYNITDGYLPPGLSLAFDGEITGKVQQYSTVVSFKDGVDGPTTFDTNNTLYWVTFDNNTTSFDFGSTKIGISVGTTFNRTNVTYGLISFDLAMGGTTFDNKTTTVDRTFTFTVAATDFYQTESLRTFSIIVNTPNTLNYSNIYVKPYMLPSYRLTWDKFINDSSIFIPSSLYRPYDSKYGLQLDLEMLIYAGIETNDLNHYSELTLNSIKRFYFENIYKAVAYEPGTKTAIYEIVYIKMIDPMLEHTTYNKNNITEWRSQIIEMGDTKWNYLPLWMRSVQPNERTHLGFTLAIPLCFCKVGKANDIILNIKHSNFDFKLLDYTIDRVIISKTIGDNTDKYIIFKNRNLQ